MNKLEELHYDVGPSELEYIVNAAKLTTDIAIKFAEWVDTSEYVQNEWRKNKIKFRNKLFEEFINNHYEKV